MRIKQIISSFNQSVDLIFRVTVTCSPSRFRSITRGLALTLDVTSPLEVNTHPPSWALFLSSVLVG